jgi:hypothetical protein
MKELLIDSFKDALFDTVKLIPFLLITYVVMEWLERKTAGRQAHVLGKAEKLGPLIGGVLGIVPQCGFSLMASNLYSGGVIGAGVLIAVFMSTSDEMLPIMLSNDAISAGTIVKILATKAVIAVITGYIVGFVLDRLRKPVQVKKIDPVHRHGGHDEHEHHGGHVHSDTATAAESSLHTQNIVYKDAAEKKGKFIIRVSQFENINYDLLNFSKPEFIWVDYNFENFNLNRYIKFLKNINNDGHINTLKIQKILVSPELYGLQNINLTYDIIQDKDITEVLNKYSVCTKIPYEWRKIV